MLQTKGYRYSRRHRTLPKKVRKKNEHHQKKNELAYDLNAIHEYISKKIKTYAHRKTCT